ncbi:MAG: gliding motility-associated C-terminal domain-containing protein, partial [Daejeonella sp.]|uniref:T9SS type B sorting domain-containing protein n=1 Tax=Daejeonella sp. TaxID=2805397 RepID=UPI003C757B1C
SDIVSITRDEVKSAGADLTVCSPATTLKLADAGAGYKWEVVAGNPSAATIDASTGDIAGMTADGVYHFILRSDYGGCADEILITRASIGLTYSKTEVLCFGESTGSIDLTVSGGTGPYVYIWSNGQTTQDLNNIGAGTYTVTVTDTKGCAATLPITISQPASLALSTSLTDVLCFSGSTGAINLSVSGGTAPYSYSWTGGVTTEDRTDLAPGTYTVTVTDANNCSVSTSVIIAQPLAPMALTSTKTDVLCSGAATGAIDLHVTGGTAPYTYSWQGGITTEDRTGLTAGTYNVTVTDAKGCQKVTDVTITELAAITASIAGTAVNCNGASSGSADLTVKGGTAPYKFLWNNGQNVEDATGLAAGIHTVTITDSNSCTATASVTITQPAVALTLSPTKTDVLCFGASNGSINLSVSGGTAPYTYSWTGGHTTKDLSGLPAGNYSVLVTDAKNCSATVSVVIAQPAAALEVKTTKTDVLCFGSSTGAVSLNVKGGKAPYTYKWNTGQSVKDLANIPAGVYNVLVTDSGNCSVSAEVEITQSEQLKAVLTAKNQVCGSSGGSISSQITGGIKPYKISWVGNSAIISGEITSAKAGIYEMIVTDAVGCTLSVKTEVRQEGCPPVASTVYLTPELSSVLEGNKVAVTARLTHSFKEDVIITVAYSGKAGKERDYLVLDQYMSLKISKGSLSTTEKMTIAALHDAFQEGDEDVILKIKTVSNPDVIIGKGAVVIINDLYPPPTPTDVPHDLPINPDIVPDALMSPNGDGNGNEFFTIKNIDLYPDNEVLIFNRWGNELFSIKNYNNNDRNFKGFANKGILVNSDLPLSDGVYFYIISTFRSVGTARNKNVNKGYIILKR